MVETGILVGQNAAELMEVNELLRKVRKIELKSRDISHHLFSGEILSLFKGRGMSFSEVREYQYSDDIRFIDWNVTARTGVPFVKIYEEERELTVMLLVDVSKSSFFGSGEMLKSELITELSAVLAFSAIQSNDKVGLILFSDRIESYIPPAKGRNQTLRIIRELVDFEPDHTRTSINGALQFLNNVVKKNSICFLISDFLDENYARSMRVAGRKHDLIAIHIEDIAEQRLPEAGLVRAIDPETGLEYWIDTASEHFRKAYADNYLERMTKLRQVLGESKVDLINLTTGEDYVKKLLKFFKSRA